MTQKRARLPGRIKYIEDVIEPRPIRRASLASAFPEIASEWHYKKNCGWGPEDFNYGSNIKVWWQCSKKHVYAAMIANRTGKRKSGCMICNVGVSTDLKDYPEALAQFDLKKNKGDDPHKITWHKRYYWKCSVASDHVWVSTFNRRKGERCPACKKSQLSKTNMLANFPRVARMLHPTKNGKWNAKNLRMAESRRVWWKCPKGPDHEWQALITTKTQGSLGCPFCNSNRVSITNCLKTMYPRVAKEWHPTRNKRKTPGDVNGQTADKYWWLCKKGHEWHQSVAIRTVRGANCPTCRTASRSGAMR